jgi:hypothetical protein
MDPTFGLNNNQDDRVIILVSGAAIKRQLVSAMLLGSRTIWR